MSEKQIKETVLALDRDGDGMLDYSDTLSVVRALGIYWPSGKEAKEMKDLGFEADTRMDCAKVAAAVSKLAAQANPKKTLTEMFKTFDRKNDGTIQESELREVLKVLGDTLSDPERDQLCSLGAKNGTISYAELVDKLLS
ncbi:calmodulin [Gregarina niphandrodes]|uniref:Calmodulin n=1 Tax=Gregarina niphandrodes TaxID=110365 RepID=A0A023B370_GRENI|nr:calmodulin [Gregarina niphandrodes]EZG55111.1 calmodulin [Gregarina niphandrodes]|eukprot:XP_011131773.1 calmodulin [Gregarina niphandrodes]